VLSTRSALVEDGRAQFAVDLSHDLFGTLELHAYKVLLDGTIVRDTRLVVVDEPNDIDVAITLNQDSYLPGEIATLDFRTTDSRDAGQGVQSALGLAVVDESVFALQRQDPGFAKLYFMLEQELMDPFYQIKGFELPAAIPPEEEPIRAAQDQAVRASWADVPVLAASVPVNSRETKMNEAHAGQRQGFSQISRRSALGMVLIPPLMFAVVVIAFWQAGVIKRTLVRFLAALGILVVVGGILACILTLAVVSLYLMEAAWLLVLLGCPGRIFSSV
jgi:hypothetical protein